MTGRKGHGSVLMEEYMVQFPELKTKYIDNMRPLFSRYALYSDETENFRIPAEPEPGQTVTIRFRTLKGNVDDVYLISGSTRQHMTLLETREGFDYYTTDITVGGEKVLYYFEICAGKIRCYYNKLGVTRDLQEQYSFGIVPGFHTPDWAKSAVFYQIFVDRFYNGDPANDVQTNEYNYVGRKVRRVEDWDSVPEAMDVQNFYGGDLQGIIDKLDYLQDLGVDVLYLNPIFVSPSNHKYDIQDYDYVDPHFGKIVRDEGRYLEEWEMSNENARRYITRVTERENLEASNQLLITLIEKLHERGMKLILDGVFNHCGSFNKWLDKERLYEHQHGYEKGAYVSADSPYRSFFKFNNEHEWPYNEFYDGWWGHDTLPKLNYEASEKLEEYILQVAKKWVSPPFNADGWRLDVAADLGYREDYNHRFWKKFRRAVKEANPHALILAEHYGDARPWMQGDEWDTVMNYDAFMEPVSWFFTGMEKHSDDYRVDMLGNTEAFCSAMRHHMSAFYNPSLQTAMNELDNHDHSRFLTRTNHRAGRMTHLGSRSAEENVNKAVLRAAVAVQMTWPGAPTLYYGDEAGVCGYTDPDNRRTYPWGHEDRKLIGYYRDVIRIHKSYKALQTGSIKMLKEKYNILQYVRFTMDEQILVAVNNRNETVTVEIGVWEAGISRTSNTSMRRVLYTHAIGYTIEQEDYEVIGGMITLEMAPRSAMILVRQWRAPI